MKSSDLSLYISRKNGRSMSLSYKAGRIMPALLILLVAFILNFAITFIVSMSSGIERLLINLGSGNIKVEGRYEGKIDGDLYYVKEATALAFSEHSSSPLFLKGVDYSSYFNAERRELLHMDSFSDEGLNPALLSKRLAENLGLKVGDRFSIMLYDERVNRTRPLLLTVSAIFASGYNEFDSSLCYIPLPSLVSEAERTEIVLRDSTTEESVLARIQAEGYLARSYKTIYSSLYSNVELSINVLYAIFIVLALLASFFSSNISINYIDRDKKDIALLFLEGLSLKEIRRLYISITLRMVVFATSLGLVLAIIFSLFTPSLLSLVSRTGLSALDAYLLSFEIIIPVLPIIIINLLLVHFSFLSLSFALRHIKGITLKDLLST